MKDNLLILGAGQYGCLVKEIAEAMDCFGIIDFLDDQNPKAIGKLSEYGAYCGAYSCAAVAMGDPQLRLQYLERLGAQFQLPQLIHPQSYVSPSAVLGPGCVVEPMAVIHTGATLGKGCLVCAGAVVNHNAIVGDGCQLDCNCTVTARAEVFSGSKVHSGEVVHPQK